MRASTGVPACESNPRGRITEFVESSAVTVVLSLSRYQNWQVFDENVFVDFNSFTNSFAGRFDSHVFFYQGKSPVDGDCVSASTFPPFARASNLKSTRI